MIIKDKGYATYLVIVYGYKYLIVNKNININLSEDDHKKLLNEYFHSSYRKSNKLFVKLLFSTN